MGALNIVEQSYSWAYALTDRRLTTHLILHHAAGSGSAQDIHGYHLKQGYSGIAYHYYIRKDGSIYRGRPEAKQGGHTKDWNYCSIGVCFEGNFETEKMGEAQMLAGQSLIDDIRNRYLGIAIGRHREFNATACPGAYFPYDEIVAAPEPPGSAEATKAPSAWAKDACDWAVGAGLFKGDDAGDFKWHDYPTRQELAVILHRLEAAI